VLNDPVNYVDPDGMREVFWARNEGGSFWYYLWNIYVAPNLTRAGPGPGGGTGAFGGGGVGGSSRGGLISQGHAVLNSDLQQELTSFLNTNCRRHLNAWAKQLGKDVTAEAGRMKFFDIRDGSPWQNMQLWKIGVNPPEDSPVKRDHTLFQFWNWGGAGEPVARLLAIGEHFRSPNVLLGPKFFDAAYLAREGLTWSAIVGHEFFHYFSRLDDAGLADALGLALGADGPSVAVQRYLEAGCPD
jgi:hypothetical protein